MSDWVLEVGEARERQASQFHGMACGLYYTRTCIKELIFPPEGDGSAHVGRDLASKEVSGPPRSMIWHKGESFLHLNTLEASTDQWHKVKNLLAHCAEDVSDPRSRSV